MTLQSTLSTITFQKTHRESMLWVTKSVGRRFKAPPFMKKGPSLELQKKKKKLIRPLRGCLLGSPNDIYLGFFGLAREQCPMFQIKCLLQWYFAVGLYSYTWMIKGYVYRVVCVLNFKLSEPCLLWNTSPPFCCKAFLKPFTVAVLECVCECAC